MLTVGSSVPERFADAQVSDGQGHVVPLRSFWHGRPCLLVFIRHFACVGCGEQVTELSPRLPELERAGVRVVLVGNGEPRYLAGFVERYALGDKPVEIVTDPSLESFREAGLVRSWWATHGPRAIVDLARAMSKGLPHLPAEGDANQQGGVLLVDVDGTLRFYHRNESLGDHPSASQLVETALVLTVRSLAARV